MLSYNSEGCQFSTTGAGDGDGIGYSDSGKGRADAGSLASWSFSSLVGEDRPKVPMVHLLPVEDSLASLVFRERTRRMISIFRVD